MAYLAEYARVNAGSKNQLEFAAPPKAAANIVRQISSLPTVAWVESSVAAEPEMFTARAIMKGEWFGNDGLGIDSLELTGEGEVVGVLDSGLDPDHCLVSEIPPLFTPYFPEVSSETRKISSYWPLVDADDEYSGHGTHTATIAAGKVADELIINHATEVISRFHGMAPGAKLHFQDNSQTCIKRSTYGLARSGLAISEAFFPQLAHGAGVKVHSNSWGSASDTYDSRTLELDTFMYDHPDFLMVKSAGNRGGYDHTITAPGAWKNGLTVGAAQNALQAWLAQANSNVNVWSGPNADEQSSLSFASGFWSSLLYYGLPFYMQDTSVPPKEGPTLVAVNGISSAPSVFADPIHACTPLVNDVGGSIVYTTMSAELLVPATQCSLSRMALNVQAAGGKAMVLLYHDVDDYSTGRVQQLFGRRGGFFDMPPDRFAASKINIPIVRQQLPHVFPGMDTARLQRLFSDYYPDDSDHPVQCMMQATWGLLQQIVPFEEGIPNPFNYTFLNLFPWYMNLLRDES